MTDKKQNPANEKLELPKGYRPMSVGIRRLEVPPIPGYHLHWFRGSAANLLRAQQAGYSYVDPDEVDLNDFDLAGDGEENKGTDMGTRVSVISGDDAGTQGQAGRLYLMKCRNEIYEYSRTLLSDQLDSTVAAIRGGRDAQGNPEKDTQHRYVKELSAPILNRKRR